MSLQSAEFDYIVVGGGLCGVTVASRLSQSKHGLRVALIEAGPDEHANPSVLTPRLARTMHGGPLQYNYLTTPQTHLGGRQIQTHGGKLLSGGSAINYGLWTRGDASDYDHWAAVVGDDRWSYKQLLPYMLQTETHHDADVDSTIHGREGPIHTTGSTTEFPLHDTVRVMLESAGLKYNPDVNSGDPTGFGEYAENWYQHQRQPAGLAFDLSAVTILTNAPVAKIVFTPAVTSVSTLVPSSLRAAGVQLVDGRYFTARAEVILSSGAFRTPQVLMHSGIGPDKTLSALNIPTQLDLPSVGHNLHDHLSIAQRWRLHPSVAARGMSKGHPLFDAMPVIKRSSTIEYIATAVSGAQGSRADVELVLCRGPAAGPPGSMAPLDGSHISTAAMALLPISRGTVVPQSADPLSDPLIDPCFLDCAVDRASLRAGMRLCMRAVESDAGRTLIESETPPDGAWPALSSESSDEELDKRIRAFCWSWFHPGGTVAMGTCLDTACRVRGVENLRVVDASALPVPLGAHYQVPLYAFALSAADLILDARKRRG